MKFSGYTNKTLEESFAAAESSSKGLSKKEAAGRLDIWGTNEIQSKEAGWRDIFLRQFKSPFFYLLFIAAVIALAVGEKIDGAVIFFFVFINTFLGFFQEAKAERAIALLKKFIPLKVKAMRGGKEETIDKKLLVPGDVVLLDAGDVVPADLRVLKAQNFLVNESVLNGESVPVAKTEKALSKEAKEIFEAKNIVFAGTSVTSGNAEGLVVATGADTALGQVSRLVSEISRESVYEKNLLKFCRLILRIVVVTIVFVFLANLIINKAENPVDFLIFSIALIVSIIPEALPLVVTLSLSEGSLELAKEKVVVKRLSAIEDLGNIEILCTDKTGTLTENKLKLEGVFSSDPGKCLLYSLLVSAYAEGELKSDPTPFDSAIFKKAPAALRSSLKNYSPMAEIPFDSFRMINSSLVKDAGGSGILIAKGAPEIILKISRSFEGGLKKEETEAAIIEKGKEGKRILAVAYKQFAGSAYGKDDENDLTFLGYLSFGDPLKRTAKSSVALAKKLGVQIKILTGDSPEVAGAVGREVGLLKDPAKEVVLGRTLASQSGEEFEKSCSRFNVFARLSPEGKYRVIRELQKKYEVGFSGDGVNDAPSLKIANVGIAVQGATDVSQEAADVILLKRDLRVIVDGILQGRNIFSNINKYIKTTLANNFGSFYSIALISFLIPYLPMLPIQILLANLLADFPFIAIATDKVDVEELNKPKAYQLSEMILLIMFLALTSTVFDFIFFGIFRASEPALLQTLWFIENILAAIVLIFSARTHHVFLKAKEPSAPLVILSLFIATSVIALPFTAWGRELFHFTVPPAIDVIIVIVLILCYFLVTEAVKLLYFRYWPLASSKHKKKLLAFGNMIKDSASISHR